MRETGATAFRTEVRQLLAILMSLNTAHTQKENQDGRASPLLAAASSGHFPNEIDTVPERTQSRRNIGGDAGLTRPLSDKPTEL